jgi:glycosyltransferase involved in cell wall biosynthesis
VGWEGKKGYMKLCRNLAKQLQVDDNVLFTGPISFTERDLLLSGYRGASVLAMPSRWENFGLVLLESMACETPFVGAYTGGTFELEQKKCGFGYNFSDITALSEKLNLLLSDKNLAKKMGMHGRQIVRTEYDIRTVAERTETLYNQVFSSY